MRDEELLMLIADHMEGGLLENIIDMFKHDRSLYRFLPDLISDERGRVRLGMAALAEALRKEHLAEMEARVPGVAAILYHEDPSVRGDAAYLLGIIGGRDALRRLAEAEKTEGNEQVRGVIAETIEELSE